MRKRPAVLSVHSANRQVVKIVEETEKTMEISRVDFWSARNFIWDDSTVRAKAWNVGKSYPNGVLSVVESTPTGIASIRDKAVKLESASLLTNGGKDLPETATTVNPVIRRQTGTDIGVGYEFAAPRTVGALLLVRGLSPAADASAYNKASNEVVIAVKREAGWERVLGQVREYVVDTAERSVVVYPDYSPGSRSAGYGLYSSHFSNENKNVTYSYITLGEPVESCKGVMLVDRSGHSFLDVAELCVFDSNPLSYITGKEVKVTSFEFGSNGASVKWSDERAPYEKLGDLLVNGNPEVVLTVDADYRGIAWVEFDFLKPVRIAQTVVWQKGGTIKAEEDYASVYGEEVEVVDSPFYKPIRLQEPAVGSALRGILSTPYCASGVYNGTPLFGPVVGNPLPYAPQGGDSPRTFAYKMREQLRARQWLLGRTTDEALVDRFSSLPTTRAIDSAGFEGYRGGYVSELDVLAQAGYSLKPDVGSFLYTGSYPANSSQLPKHADGTLVKPFLPGLYLNTPEGYAEGQPSQYEAEKSAGVDALGLLSGALAASSVYGKVTTVLNEDALSSLDAYFQMEAGAGLPPFYTGGDLGTPLLATVKRFTRADFERNSVIVPEIRDLQRGDLLVRYNAAGEPHVGIVVGYEWSSTKPAYGANVREWWDQVYVVSVRRGFRQVTLGRWGNREGVFGGFTTAPEDYQIRRLLRVKDGVALTRLEAATQTDSWELIDEVPKRTYLVYPSSKEIPRDSPQSFVLLKLSEIQKNNATYTAEQYLKDQLEYLKNGEIFGGRFPGNAVTDTYKDKFFLKFLPPTSYYQKPAQNLPLEKVEGDKKYLRITCLTGWRNIDGRISYHRGIDVSNGGMVQNSTRFRAPEDGRFYVFSSTDAIHLNGLIPVNSSETEKFRIEPYLYNVYGNIGVLITNPNNPREGRVYVFAHLGDENTQTGAGNTVQTGVDVKAGDELEYIDGGPINNGTPTYAVHIHLDVYEYFDDVVDISVEGDDSYGWQRIDPLSLFEVNKWIDYADTEKNVQSPDAYELYLQETHRTDFTDEQGNILEQKIFKLWFLAKRYVDSFFRWK